MARRKLQVVISQAPGKHPIKRQLEEELATALMLEPDVEVSLIPHVYDLTPDHHGLMWLKSLPGDFVILAWLYPRAVHWILDRQGIRGQLGRTLLVSGEETTTDDETADHPSTPTSATDVSSDLSPDPTGAAVPKRRIYALDLRSQTQPGPYLEEIRRIARESNLAIVELTAWSDNSSSSTSSLPILLAPSVNEQTRRRWYPVIDYSRCTNCLECLDFCLFGVYGVDQQQRIVVENQDECKKGCPACSRVCPANAIIFPEHKSPAIAGAAGGEVSDFKIDLSRLFGGPSALELAVQERDAELIKDGREAVGATVGLRKRQSDAACKPRDALDDLLDGLESF
ncbi:MAG: Fe-S oxidoreductase [Planctomycetaceae bacterium]|nr:MAG: Fe-S oxidoreductase [Planctomycetaceae bacterium]